MNLGVSYQIGDLVYYIGPPVVSPTNWELIVVNDNGILNKDDIGVIISLDDFLKIADVFFQENKITLNRVSFSKLKAVEY